MWQAAGEEAQAAYDARPTRVTLAIVAAAVTGLVGAAIWAFVAIKFEMMFWLLAIGIGVAIGVATAKAAGKGGWLVQFISIVATVVSVVAGNVMVYAYGWSQASAEEGIPVDWPMFVRYIPEMLVEGGSDTLFALGGGLIGAFYAARLAGREKLEVHVE
ncbi:MAG: hypothetical protein PVJ57_06580 [Phycisphaerae bacterium]|jgi:hypothetical protein